MRTILLLYLFMCGALSCSASGGYWQKTTLYDYLVTVRPRKIYDAGYYSSLMERLKGEPAPLIHNVGLMCNCALSSIITIMDEMIKKGAQFYSTKDVCDDYGVVLHRFVDPGGEGVLYGFLTSMQRMEGECLHRPPGKYARK
jgi:hypothetical protein